MLQFQSSSPLKYTTLYIFYIHIIHFLVKLMRNYLIILYIRMYVRRLLPRHENLEGLSGSWKSRLPRIIHANYHEHKYSCISQRVSYIQYLLSKLRVRKWPFNVTVNNIAFDLHKKYLYIRLSYIRMPYRVCYIYSYPNEIKNLIKLFKIKKINLFLSDWYNIFNCMFISSSYVFCDWWEESDFLITS